MRRGRHIHHFSFERTHTTHTHTQNKHRCLFCGQRSRDPVTWLPPTPSIDINTRLDLPQSSTFNRAPSAEELRTNRLSCHFPAWNSIEANSWRSRAECIRTPAGKRHWRQVKEFSSSGIYRLPIGRLENHSFGTCWFKPIAATPATTPAQKHNRHPRHDPPIYEGRMRGLDKSASIFISPPSRSYRNWFLSSAGREKQSIWKCKSIPLICMFQIQKFMHKRRGEKEEDEEEDEEEEEEGRIKMKNKNEE